MSRLDMTMGARVGFWYALMVIGLIGVACAVGHLAGEWA